MTVGISRDFYGLSDDEEESGLDMSLMDHNPDNDLGALGADYSQIATNPPSLRNFLTSQRGWRALRLPGARVAERGDLFNFMAQFIPGFKGNTIRDSPYRFMITAPMWNNYIRNMEPQDDAMELNAPISEQEILSIRLFCDEWKDDPSHNDFVRRLINHPSVNTADAIQKGTLVYQFATRELRLRTAHPDSYNPYPARLMMDILNSIPFKSYHFYSLNNLHLHEGPRIYEEFLNRYVPLSATEVAMVEEINSGVQGMGSSYANMTTNINGDITMAFMLMEQVLESYAIGDTKTVRLTLNMLLSPPYNFNSVANKINVSGVSGGQYLSKSQVVIMNIPGPGTNNKTKKDAKMSAYTVLKTYVTRDGSKKTIGNDVRDAYKLPKDEEGYLVTLDNSGMFVNEVLSFRLNNDKMTVRLANEGEYNSALKQLVDRVGAGRAATPVTDTRDKPDRNRDEGRGRRSITGPRRNPGHPELGKSNPKGRFGAKSTMGDGKNIYVMFHNHKTRMEFRGKYKSRKSKTAHAHQLGGVKMSDPTGMADAFPSRQGKLNGYFLKVGFYKRTGTPEPFMASLPRSHFAQASMNVTINGEKKKIRTIKMLKGTEKQKKAWAKFKKFYGIPVFVGGGPGDTNTFKIHSKKQGSYYTKLRKKPSKK